MLNLIQMEKHHIRKTKSFYVTLILEALLVFFFAYNDSKDSTSIDYFATVSKELSSGFIMLLTPIFITLFVTSEQKNGFIKSLAGQLPRRSDLAISKCVVCLIYALSMLVVIAVSLVISAFLFYKQRNFAFETQYLWKIPLQIAILTVFGNIFVFLALLTRSSAWGVSLGICYGGGLLTFLYMGIDWAVDKLGISATFSSTDYVLESMITDFADLPILRVVIVTAIYAVIFISASTILLKKRDIK